MSTVFRAILEGSQEVPANGSTASGLGTIIFDSAAVAASYSFVVQGVDYGPATGRAPQTPTTLDDVVSTHFHNQVRGVNGPVVFGQISPAQDNDDLVIVPNADGSWTVSGRWETTDPANASIASFASVLGSAAGGSEVPLYFNVHTTQFPAGEIRGQLISISNNVVNGTAGSDRLFGELGNDWFDGGAGDDFLFGLEGNDTLGGGEGNDWLDGGGGSDLMVGGTGNETMAGGDGTDFMYGEAGTDLLVGGAGNDVMSGGADNDFLYGEAGDDIIEGGDSDDLMHGGAGVDSLFGQGGNDTYLFDVATSGLDVIFDIHFGPGPSDQVVIQNGGAIDTFAELIGNAYQDGADVVIAFNATTGIYIKNHTIAQLDAGDFLFT
jgi:serralysin